MKKIFSFFNDLITDRGNGKNSKIFVGLIFALVMIIGLFVKVDNALYQTLAFCMLSLFGISAVDNLTAPKIEINKTETTQKDTKTEIDIAEIVGKIKRKK